MGSRSSLLPPLASSPVSSSPAASERPQQPALTPSTTPTALARRRTRLIAFPPASRVRLSTNTPRTSSSTARASASPSSTQLTEIAHPGSSASRLDEFPAGWPTMAPSRARQSAQRTSRGRATLVGRASASATGLNPAACAATATKVRFTLVRLLDLKSPTRVGFRAVLSLTSLLARTQFAPTRSATSDAECRPTRSSQSRPPPARRAMPPSLLPSRPHPSSTRPSFLLLRPSSARLRPTPTARPASEGAPSRRWTLDPHLDPPPTTRCSRRSRAPWPTRRRRAASRTTFTMQLLLVPQKKPRVRPLLPRPLDPAKRRSSSDSAHARRRTRLPRQHPPPPLDRFLTSRAAQRARERGPARAGQGHRVVLPPDQGGGPRLRALLL